MAVVRGESDVRVKVAIDDLWEDNGTTLEGGVVVVRVEKAQYMVHNLRWDHGSSSSSLKPGNVVTYNYEACQVIDVLKGNDLSTSIDRYIQVVY